VLIGAVGLGSVPIITPLKLATPPIVNYIWPRLASRQLVALVVNMAFGTKERPTQRDIDEYWAPTQFDEFAWACRACVHRATWIPMSETQLRSLRLPVLVISGGRDRIVRGDASRARLIPTARVVPIQEGGHLVMQECSGITNAEILQFLRSGGEPRQS
jgi:pimeloyl-ACP methyl ester carboxylesterase